MSYASILEFNIGKGKIKGEKNGVLASKKERGEVKKTDQNITTVRRSYSLVDGVSRHKRGATVIRVVLVVRRMSFQPLELTTPSSDRRKWSKNKKKKKKDRPVSVLFGNK